MWNIWFLLTYVDTGSMPSNPSTLEAGNRIITNLRPILSYIVTWWVSP